MDEYEKFKLKKTLNELEEYTGSGTELVSVYVPAGYQLHSIIEHIFQEQGTATNIKSNSTRKNVTDALEKMIQQLKMMEKTPKNGLAIFSGNVAEREGKSDVKVWSIVPPIPLNVKIYKCDKSFVLHPLKDMLTADNTYGLIVMDRREAALGELYGKSIKLLTTLQSPVPGKTKAGGQSAQRFERIRKGMVKDFFKKIGEHAKKAFLGKKEIEGILLGGPGPTKYKFFEGDFLPTEIKEKVIAKKDLSNCGEDGLDELVNLSEDVLENQELVKERIHMEEFFKKLAKNPNIVTYGKEEVMKALNLGACDKILILESLEDEFIEKVHETAKDFSTKVQLVSDRTKEGMRFKNFKIAAILRYELHM